MTQPIQEPSTDRSIQGIAYQRDQLLRRPAPNSVANVPWMRRSKEAEADQTVAASGGETEITYDEVYSENASGVLDDVGSQYIQVLVDGLFGMIGRLYWSSSPDLVGLMFTSQNPLFWVSYPTIAQETSFTLSSYGMLIARLESGQQIRVDALNFDGTDQDVSGSGGTYFEMWFLGNASPLGNAFT